MKEIKLISLIKKNANILKKNYIFYGHGTNNPFMESKYIIYTILQLDINKKYEKIKINKKQENKIKKTIKKRIKNKIPVPYITKIAYFYNKKFFINRNVIIPRSPLGEIIKKNFKYLKNFKPKNILDLCTGSGCLAILCSYFFYKAKIEASDISISALKIAKKNIILHKKKIKLIKSNLFNNIKKKYDLIITNPPYIDIKDFKYLPKEYYYEPKISLISKKKGMFFIEKIIKNAKKYLKNNGLLLCEIGNNKKKIKKLFPKLKIKWINLKYGIKGIFIIKKNNLF